ncbi:MAG TPA: hypothetical protein VG694_02860, partial [Candidatus Paceibacterota bacterium]|nr:hypothetical protein [Candidatus Paceibacterota bacterium]
CPGQNSVAGFFGTEQGLGGDVDLVAHPAGLHHQIFVCFQYYFALQAANHALILANKDFLARLDFSVKKVYNIEVFEHSKPFKNKKMNHYHHKTNYTKELAQKVDYFLKNSSSKAEEEANNFNQDMLDEIKAKEELKETKPALKKLNWFQKLLVRFSGYTYPVE